MKNRKRPSRSLARIPVLLSITLSVVAAIGPACSTVAKVGTSIAQEKGYIDEKQAGSINRSAEAVEKTYQDITPEQEYYIGRSVAATVLSTYRPYDDQAANAYVNLLGQTIARASDRPDTYGGYHFLILDTEEINAFAAPGGFIMISRGMIRCCRSEDELAAVLAHEIGHVANRDGLRAIKKSRMTSALTILAVEGASNLGGEQLAKLTEEFEGSITDITSTLMNSGYSRSLEKQADGSAVAVLGRVGYDPRALGAMLGEMKKRLKPGGLDFAKTHPDPADRIRDLEGSEAGPPPPPEPPSRRERFSKALESA
ncbi:MAG: M48 family metalloprotease [Candidatus Eisenbacteria bacterium]